MKLVRIGSASTCDIVLKSDYVSSLHAELTILDDGTLILEDKNSKNGTKVGNETLTPGKEVTVQRGDLITFADKTLTWTMVPKAENLKGYKAVYNIGSNYRNEIILNGQAVSRYHASLRIKDGKAFIHDNGSRNGTMLNGVKVEKDKDIRIKRGDNVVCGTEDITEQIAGLIPGNPIGRVLGIGAGIVAAAAVVALIIWPPKPKPGKEVDPSVFRPATVYVTAAFHYVVKFDDNPMPDMWHGTVPIYQKVDEYGNKYSFGYQATAFFLDSLGRMGTNRHVALPWEDIDKEDENQIRKYIEEILNPQNMDYLLKRTELGDTILKRAEKESWNDVMYVENVMKITDRLRKARYNISGVIDYISVGYPGRYYTHEDEYQRCNVLRVSDTGDIDLAILQLNDKKTPDDIKVVFRPDRFYTGRLEPLKDALYTIGYPAGKYWAQDDKTKSMEPSIRETKCSKEPGRYDFEFQANSIGGSSGSPVFNKYGELVGVLYGGYSLAGGATKAVHAKYLKQMYDAEVNY